MQGADRWATVHAWSGRRRIMVGAMAADRERVDHGGSHGKVEEKDLFGCLSQRQVP